MDKHILEAFEKATRGAVIEGVRKENEALKKKLELAKKEFESVVEDFKVNDKEACATNYEVTALRCYQGARTVLKKLNN